VPVNHCSAGLKPVVGRQGHLPFGEDFAESGSQEKDDWTMKGGEIPHAADPSIRLSLFIAQDCPH
jgi:hypothetical protein